MRWTSSTLAKSALSIFGKGLVTQNAGIGAEQIDLAPLPRRAVDHRLTLREVGEIGAVGHCHAARLADLLDHRLRRRQRTSGAVACATEIVDDDLRAAARQPERVRAAKTIARAGD